MHGALAAVVAFEKFCPSRTVVIAYGIRLVPLPRAIGLTDDLHRPAPARGLRVNDERHGMLPAC
jgi:hypothetical protein